MTSYSDEVILMRERRHKKQKKENMYQQAKEIRRSVRNLAERTNKVEE